MKQISLGQTGPVVSSVGLGCLAMSDLYGPADADESAATIRAALDAGVTLFDTGDFYGMGHNELVLREALKDGKRNKAFIQVKFGAQRSPDGAFIGFDTRPAAVKTALAYTLKRLNTDYVDLYMPARLDPAVPIEDTVGAIADMVKAGHVRQIGLSEVGAATIRRAAAVHPISDLQIEYSLISRGIEDGILATCRELGIAVTAYGVLSRGLISGHWTSDKQAPGDFRSYSPRFQQGNLESNLRLVEALRRSAQARGVSVAQIAIAWVLAQGRDIVPLIGARKRGQLAEALGALDVKLSANDLADLDKAVPKGAASGGRYPPAQLDHLDSER